MTDHQFSLFVESPPAVKELQPLYLCRFDKRIYHAKDRDYIDRFAAFWGFNAPVEYAPVYFRVEGVELRRIEGIRSCEETGQFL